MVSDMTSRPTQTGPAESESDPSLLVLTELSGLLLDREDLASTLQRVADICLHAVVGCDAAGVTLVQDGRYLTAASTGARTLAVDQAQYVVGAGPCLDAMRTGERVQVDVEQALAAYPSFARAALEQGVCSFLAAPLSVEDQTIGALNLYSENAGAFAGIDEDLVLMMSRVAGAAVSNARAYAAAATLASQLQEALESRAVIEQAKGILMQRTGLNADAAFAMLRTTSQHQNRKLRTVAADLVAGAGPEANTTVLDGAARSAPAVKPSPNQPGAYRTPR